MLNASPTVEKLALLFTFIIDDAPENVRLVVAVISIAGFEEKLIMELPSVIERILLLLLSKSPILQVWLFVLNEPLFT